MKSKKLWKSFEKQECTWVMSEKRKRRQEALIRLLTLLAWPPSSYFHIFQALFLWKQSHIFLTCRFASFVMDMLPLSFVTSFFEDQVAQFESTSFRQTKSKSHPYVQCKESDDFFGRPCHQFRPTVVSNHQPCQMWRRDRCKNLDGSITSVMPVSYSEKLNINFIV